MMQYFSLALAVTSVFSCASAAFIHPGHLLKDSDIWRIAELLDTSPWSDAWASFKSSGFSNVDWTLNGPNEVVTRDADASLSNSGDTQLMNDAQAAWQLSLLWALGHDESAAKKAVEILDAWGSTLKVCNGSDAQLAAALSGTALVYAAEIIRYTYSADNFTDGWTSSSIETFTTMVTDVLFPQMSQTEPTAEQKYPFEANWGTSGEKAMLAVAIFTDDTKIYQQAKDLITGSSCANLTGTIAASGQSSESGRDQQHTQLGLGNLGEAFQMLWTQGEDWFSLEDNRLMAGIEYTAKYLAGNDVDYDPSFYRCDANLLGGPWSVISSDGRDLVRPVFELPYAHYVGLKNLSMPYTAQLIVKTGPDGENPTNSVTDGVGFQTLLFRKNATIS